jgi:hypothetical protein
MVGVLVQHIQTTVGLLLFCVLGVAGQIDTVGVDPVGITALVQWSDVTYGIALPPVAYYTPGTWAGDNVRLHELGHLMQWRDFGPFYYVVVGLPSVLYRVTRRDVFFAVEADANRRGGVRL